MSKEINKDIKSMIENGKFENATYRGLKETIKASGLDYGHGQLYQLGSIILNKDTPGYERFNAYRMMVLSSLALFTLWQAKSDDLTFSNAEDDIAEQAEQMDLFQSTIGRSGNGTKDNTKD